MVPQGVDPHPPSADRDVMRVSHRASKTNSHFFRVSKLGETCAHQRVWATQGKKLWREIHAVFDFEDEPHKVQVLTQACRVADVVAELDEAADEAPLTVKGAFPAPARAPLTRPTNAASSSAVDAPTLAAGQSMTTAMTTLPQNTACQPNAS